MRVGRVVNIFKYIGRTCEACGATSEIEKWTLTDKGLQCPVCSHVQGGTEK
jgi:DNA-directed RNA polymerase subunit RPC12/RpoP